MYRHLLCFRLRGVGFILEGVFGGPKHDFGTLVGRQVHAGREVQQVVEELHDAADDVHLAS